MALWGEREPEHVSVGETLFEGGMRLRTYFAKWHEGFERRNTPLVYDSAIAPALRAAVVEAARGAWYVVGARGYLTVDVRLDAVNQHLHKPSVIGRMDEKNVIWPVRVSDGLIAPAPWSGWLARNGMKKAS